MFERPFATIIYLYECTNEIIFNKYRIQTAALKIQIITESASMVKILSCQCFLCDRLNIFKFIKLRAEIIFGLKTQS